MSPYFENWERTAGHSHEEASAVAYCDHCGFAIYSADDALVLPDGDVIHADCWPEYAEEHMFDFAQKASETDRFGS